MPLPLYNGARYRAEITLSGVEKWAGNGTIQGKLEEAGFQDVVVQGSGAVRIAEGTWTGGDVADAESQVPSQVTAVVEI